MKRIEPARPRGRPRLAEQKSTVSVWLPATDHDRLIRIAKARETSVSAVVRHVLTHRGRRPYLRW